MVQQSRDEVGVDVQLPDRWWPWRSPQGIPLPPAVVDEMEAIVRLQRGQDAPEERPLCLLVLGPVVRQVEEEVPVLDGLWPDPLHGELGPVGDDRVEHLRPLEVLLLGGHDLLEEAERAALEGRHKHLLQ